MACNFTKNITFPQVSKQITYLFSPQVVPQTYMGEQVLDVDIDYSWLTRNYLAVLRIVKIRIVK